MEEGKLPSEWKDANVTAIFKAGDRKKAENYRPISITSICCRLMEKIIRDSIVEHLESNNLISPNQHGFRKGFSCATQLIECIEDWSEAVDEGKNVDALVPRFQGRLRQSTPRKATLESLGVWDSRPSS